MSEGQQKEANEIARLKETNLNEVAEWAKLSDKYKEQLNRFNLSCQFCEAYLDENNVNEDCVGNAGKKKNKESNTGRHYFVRPREEPASSMPTEQDIKAIFDKIRSELPTYLSLEVLIGKHFRENETASDKHFIKFVAENFDFLEDEAILKLCAYFNTASENLRVDKHRILHNKKLISITSVLMFLEEEDLGRTTFRQSFGGTSKSERKVQGNASNSFKVNETDIICQLVSKIESSDINLYHELTKMDVDSEGLISADQLRLALLKLPFNISSKEIDAVFKYFYVKENEKLDVKKFVENLMKYR